MDQRASKEINMIIYFKILIVKVFVFYVFNKYVKNFILIKYYLLFNSKTLFFMHNFILQKIEI